MVEAALAEALYAAAMWNGDIVEARNVMDTAAEATGHADALLSGWQYVWVGAALEAERDIDGTHLAYRKAMSRLGSIIALPRVVGADGRRKGRSLWVGGK
ncbi:MAG: hypothetical protein MI755_00645 [Sphingomonadales bacterium]|nr:hypothetical protein [Sphingomonadales bacterium]